MFKTRIIGIYQTLSVFEIFLSQAFYWFALMLFEKYYDHGVGFIFDLDAYTNCSIILLVSMLVLFWKTDFQQISLITPSFIHSYRWSFHRTIVSLGSILFYLFLTKNESVSRAFLFTHFGMQFLTVFVTHRYFPEFFAMLSFGSKRKQNILFVGPLKKAVRMKNWMLQKGMLGMTPIGVMTTDAEEGHLSGLQIISPQKGIEKILKELRIAQVILLEIPEKKSELRGIFNLFEKFGVRLLIVNDLEETLGHSVVMIEDDGFQMIGMRTEPLENPFNRGLKRAIDILISLPVIFFVLPPLMLIITRLQKKESPGPLLVSQKRGGMQGHHFKMLKFRTMHTHHQQITKQATAGDQRIYPSGRWLRKFSIDELPQFINVLRGEMSVVGPRPHLIEHDEAFSQVTQNYLVRSYVKPGITGLSQVKGLRGATSQSNDLHDRVSSDIYYIENWSLRMDFEIILRTIRHMLFPPSSAI